MFPFLLLGKLSITPLKNLVFIFLFFLVVACNQSTENSSRSQAEIDSLHQQLYETYPPGMGEFMSGIQIHHTKLWFAVTSNNWGLVDFEIKEIQEAIENIRKFNLNRPEINSIGIIIPAIDSVSYAIRQQNAQSLES